MLKVGKYTLVAKRPKIWWNLYYIASYLLHVQVNTASTHIQVKDLNYVIRRKVVVMEDFKF